MKEKIDIGKTNNLVEIAEKLKSSKNIIIDFTKTDDTFFSQLVPAISEATSIIELHFNSLSSNNFSSLISLIQTNVKIRTVEIRKYLSEEDASKLSERLNNALKNDNLYMINFNLSNFSKHICLVDKKIAERNKRFAKGELFIKDEIPFSLLESVNGHKLNETITSLTIENCFTKDTQDIVTLLSQPPNFPNLNNLSLPNNSLGDDFIGSFKELYSKKPFTLRTLNIENNTLTVQSIKILLEILQDTTDLTIYINGNPINFEDPLFNKITIGGSFKSAAENDDAITFSKFSAEKISLLKSTTLNRVLKIRNLNVVDEQYKDVLFSKQEVLTFSQKLKGPSEEHLISLMDNNILCNPIRFLFNKNCLYFSFSPELISKVIHNKKIGAIDFRHINKKSNLISNEELIKIIDLTLTRNSSVTKISIAADKLFSDGIKKLAEILSSNESNLAFLDIENIEPKASRPSTGITNEMATLLIKSLKQNKKLISLSLNNNLLIDGAIVNSLVDNLLVNRTLTSLNICTSLGEQGLKGLIKGLDPVGKRKPRNNSLSILSAYTAHLNGKPYAKPLRDALEKFNASNASKKNEFLLSIEQEEIGVIKQHAKEASIYCCNDDGNYVLHLAVKYNRADIVAFFVKDCNYNLELTNKQGQTPLLMALEKQKQLEGSNKETSEIIKIVQTLKNPIAKINKGLLSPKPAGSKNSTMKRKSADNYRPEEERLSKKQKKVINPAKMTTTSMASMPGGSIDNSVCLSPKIPQMNELDERDEDNFTDSFSENSPLLPVETLINFIACGNVYQLEEKLSSTPRLIHYIDTSGKSLLHITIEYNNLSIVKLLLEKGADCNRSNPKNNNLTPLAYAIDLLKSGHFALQSQTEIMLIIQELLKAGTELNGFLLHLSIQMGNYRLMKLILNSPQCDPNEKNDSGLTPLMCAIYKENIEMVSRFLIDRRLKIEIIQEALDLAKTLQEKKLSPFYSYFSMDGNLQKIIAKLNWRCQVCLPEERAGIQWVKSHTLFYGSSSERPQKSLKICSDKEHAYLASLNNYTKEVYLNDGDKSNKILLSNAGNPVTASLVFILSKETNAVFATKVRTKIRVPLNFNETYHIATSPEETVETVKHRAFAAPKDAFEKTFPQRDDFCHPLSPKAIEQKYQDLQENNDPGFYQLFHHGEQSLMDDLEQEGTIVKIVQKLISHPKYIQGAKIHAVILDLYSPRYPCENCEIGILGEQNYEKSKFLKMLSTILKNYGFVLPIFSPIRMITQVSSHFEHNSSAITEEEHKALMVDIRSCNNNLILGRDLNSSETKATQYHSNQNQTLK